MPGSRCRGGARRRSPRSSTAWDEPLVDLDILAGEVFALLGPNGAGKTTTVEILEGYRTRSAGEVGVLGRDPARPTAGLEVPAGHRPSAHRRPRRADGRRAGGPDPGRDLASLLPLKWLAQGMRSVFLPEDFAAAEAAGSWQLGLVALVPAAWTVGGLVLALTTFRWRRGDDG